MRTDHTFELPTVTPLDGGFPTTVCLRVVPADAERILRALDEVSLNLATTPSGSRVAGAYRCLAAELRRQAGGMRAASRQVQPATAQGANAS
jgi:hypothetical protein